jgi:hypothetical protein
LAINHAAFEEASCCPVNKPVSATVETDLKALVDGLTLPMNED